MNNKEKINSLQKYIEKLNQQLLSPSPKRKEQLTQYKSWVELELKRTNLSIDRLRLGEIK